MEAVEQTGTLEEAKKDHAEGLNGGIKFTPEEEAAARFTYLLPFIKKSGSILSAKAMARVLFRLAEFPLGDSIDIDKMGFRSPGEKQLFRLMYEANAAKTVILNYTKQVQAAQAAEKETNNESRNEN